MTVNTLVAPSPEQIEQAKQCLYELKASQATLLTVRDKQDLIEQPGILEALCWPGAINLEDHLLSEDKELLWELLEHKRPDLLDGYATNLAGDTRPHAMKKSIPTHQLTRPGVRGVYLKRLKRWSDERSECGADGANTESLVAESLQERIHSLIIRNTLSSRKRTFEDANITTTFYDLAKAGGQTMVAWALNELLTIACTEAPGNNEKNTTTQAARAGEIARGLLDAGGDGQAINKTLLKLMESVMGGEQVEHPNLLQQILWWRSVSGFGPLGSQGEPDPLINALIDGGGDWQAAWNASCTSDTMRETLRQHPLVRRGLLADMTIGRSEKSHGHKKKSM